MTLNRTADQPRETTGRFDQKPQSNPEVALTDGYPMGGAHYERLDFLQDPQRDAAELMVVVNLETNADFMEAAIRHGNTNADVIELASQHQSYSVRRAAAKSFTTSDSTLTRIRDEARENLESARAMKKAQGLLLGSSALDWEINAVHCIADEAESQLAHRQRVSTNNAGPESVR